MIVTAAWKGIHVYLGIAQGQKAEVVCSNYASLLLVSHIPGAVLIGFASEGKAILLKTGPCSLLVLMTLPAGLATTHVVHCKQPKTRPHKPSSPNFDLNRATSVGLIWRTC